MKAAACCSSAWGPGLGTTLVLDSKTVVPMEAGHLPYRKGRTFEDHVGQRGIDRFGRKRWRRFVDDVATRLRLAFVADYVVLGGGNSRLSRNSRRKPAWERTRTPFSAASASGKTARR